MELGENTSSFIEQEHCEDASFHSELLLQFLKLLWALYVDFVRFLSNWQEKPNFPLTLKIPGMVGGKWWLEGIDAIIGNILWNSCNLPVSDIYGLIPPQQIEIGFKQYNFGVSRADIYPGQPLRD